MEGRGAAWDAVGCDQRPPLGCRALKSGHRWAGGRQPGNAGKRCDYLSIVQNLIYSFLRMGFSAPLPPAETGELHGLLCNGAEWGSIARPGRRAGRLASKHQKQTSRHQRRVSQPSGPGPCLRGAFPADPGGQRLTSELPAPPPPAGARGHGVRVKGGWGPRTWLRVRLRLKE